MNGPFSSLEQLRLDLAPYFGCEHRVEIPLDVLMFREPGEGNEGLPPGAIKCDDPAVELTLCEAHASQLAFYQTVGIGRSTGPGWRLENYHTRHSAIYEGEFAGYDIFNGHESPKVEGKQWREAGAVETAEGNVYIFSCRMGLTSGGSPAPIVYHDEGVSLETIRDVVDQYVAFTARGLEKSLELGRLILPKLAEAMRRVELDTSSR